MGEFSSPGAPVWRLIAESAGTDQGGSEAVVVNAAHVHWRDDFSAALAGAEPGELIFATVDRRTVRAVLGLLAHGVWRRPPAPTVAEVADFLREWGVQLEQRYALWPSAQHVRVAYRQPSPRASSWVQRSGVLGGGGRRVWARALARSALFTPFSRLMTPGVALMGRIPSSRSRLSSRSR